MLQPQTQSAVADAGAIKPLVALLSEEDDLARRKAAGALAALGCGSATNQDAVEKYHGITKLVHLLGGKETEGKQVIIADEVRAEAAAALAVLASGNRRIQDRVALIGGIGPLVQLLQGVGVSEQAKEEAAAALWSLVTCHYENQVAVADAKGIEPLTKVLSRILPFKMQLPVPSSLPCHTCWISLHRSRLQRCSGSSPSGHKSRRRAHLLRSR